MPLTLRAKLLAIVAAITVAFVGLIAFNAVNASRVEARLGAIQQRLIPRMELGPKLVARFDQLRRALQDAVAAHDAEALERTRDAEKELLAAVSDARDAMDPADVGPLRDAIHDWYSAAYDVSKRLLAAETGEDLVEAVSGMQTKQARVTSMLEKATAFDRTELTRSFEEARLLQREGQRTRLAVSVACLAFVLALSLWASQGLLRSVGSLQRGLGRFADGKLDEAIRIEGRDELAAVAEAANQMARRLEEASVERDRTDWIKAGVAGLMSELRGELTPAEAASRSVRWLARYTNAPAGALYVVDEQDTLRQLGSYALDESHGAKTFRVGEGLVGEAVTRDEITVVRDVPKAYFKIESGVGEAEARSVVFVPLRRGGTPVGVLELARFTPLSDRDRELLALARESVAIALEVARSRAATAALLEETQRQAERLARQEEELRNTNDELLSQQEELRQINEELKRQTDLLAETQTRLVAKNAELATVSEYKSQFLANMSHELRTPLNSMLLLSNMLADNAGANLTEKQVEYARTIHSAGTDLLALINQVLDLAKVESGKQDVREEEVVLADVASHAERVFGPVAREKELVLAVDMDPAAPTSLRTDGRLLLQILNNLLGNAIKFTERGSVTLRIRRVEEGVAFAVVDTGLGIPAAHQARIFEPFEQVEGASDRRFGGTGLGLTISRELATLLGGRLVVESAPGKGSTFTLTLPFERRQPLARPRPTPEARRPPTAAEEPFLLVIEDDPTFARVVGDLIGEQGLPHVVAPDGTTGLRIARDRLPAGIVLDLRLPDISGWAIMEELRANPSTASIPVHIVSAAEGAERALSMGAIGYLRKPASREDLVQAVQVLAAKAAAQVCRVLVVEDDAMLGDSLVEKLSHEKIQARRVSSARDALAALEGDAFTCVVLDLSLPDMDGLDLLDALESRLGPQTPPVVVYTGRALSKEETRRLESYAQAVVLKDGPSTERLLAEIRLFARRLRENLRPEKPVPAQATADIRLEGKRILVVDDDMRTVYAVSAALRSKGADVLVAENGRVALEQLEANPDVDAVLMDIMMPEMDGYEATRRIRANPRFRTMPIIALTAKAMKHDREKCIEAGASDYLTKPIDPTLLLSTLDARLREST